MKFTSPEDDEIARLRKANAELRRLLDIAHNALRAIRGAGYNTTAWATWAQRTAAWGMAPSKWPKQPDDAPAEDYTADLQRQLAEREREIADLIHPHDLAKYRSVK